MSWKLIVVAAAVVAAVFIRGMCFVIDSMHAILLSSLFFDRRLC